MLSWIENHVRFLLFSRDDHSNGSVVASPNVNKSAHYLDVVVGYVCTYVRERTMVIIRNAVRIHADDVIIENDRRDCGATVITS